MSRTRIKRMSINQHALLGNDLKVVQRVITGILEGQEYQGLVPKKVVRKLTKINKYLSAARTEMGDISLRQHPNVENSLLGAIYTSDEVESRENEG